MKKGFTLVELLAVIVILSLLMLIVFPRIINSIKNSLPKSDKLNEELVYSAANIYIQNNENYYKKKNNAVYCISLDDLVKEDLLKSPMTLSDSEEDITRTKSVQLTYKKGFIYNLINKDACKEIIPYEDAVLKGSDPELVDGLTPVIYNEDHWEIADTTTKWYDYSSQQWANAVILNDNVSKEPGTVIYPDGKNINIKAMFVWVPRYSYTIGNTYGVQLEGGDAPSQVAPGAIDIKFIDKNTKEDGIAAYKGDSPTEWHTHPAFTFGSEELSGIWVGKFETTGNASNPTILPNVTSLRGQIASEQFTTAQKFKQYLNNNGDSHMMKNSEWGAVAYLSQSKYGKYGNIDYNGTNKEVYRNDSSSYYTGKSSGKASLSSTTANGTYSYDVNLNGTGASTTGNIYGIYDMNGGAIDILMAWVKPSKATKFGTVFGYDYNSGGNAIIDYAGFSEDPDEKYYDIYYPNMFSYDGSESFDFAVLEYFYGHGGKEVACWYINSNSCHTGYSGNYPWIGHSSIFYTDYDSNDGSFAGAGSSRAAFRVVIS